MTQHLRFATLQGKTARRLLPAARRCDLDSVVYRVGGQNLTKSTAVLSIARQFRGWDAAPLRLLARVGLWVPEAWRDAVYDALARRRYQTFGRRDTCRLPTPAERSRFLD